MLQKTDFVNAGMKTFDTAAEAVKSISSGERVFVHGSAATPRVLLDALFRRSRELQNVELTCITTIGMPDLNTVRKEAFFLNSLFVSKDTRAAVNTDVGDYVPVFLSEIPLLFDREILPVDVALIHVSEPDQHGFCSLGTSIDIAKSAVRNAKTVIAQVNSQMPRTLGDSLIHMNEITFAVYVNDPLPEVDYKRCANEQVDKIARTCAELIDNRSTLQMGIGAIPDAVLSNLNNHKDLGIHSEMISDGVLPLVESGVITNKYKRKHRGKIVASFALGTRKLYDFIDDNPFVAFLDIAYVNDAGVIRQNPKTIAINSALEIDLTGQVCADTIGELQYSGVGGQMDFIRGAALSEGGKPIIAMKSVTETGKSKIAARLTPGSAVVTTRAHVHYVVTEYGAAYLFGKNLRQRAVALMSIAHPDHRDALDREIFRLYGKTIR